jgi:hypothetical protein
MPLFTTKAAIDRDLLKQAALQKEQERQLAMQRSQAALQPLMRGLPTTAAAVLGPMLTSDDPRLQQLGAQQLQEYQARRAPAAEKGVNLPGTLFSNYTPESIAEYQDSGNPAVLKYRPDPLAAERLDLAREREDRMRMASGRLPAGQMEAMIRDESVDANLDATASALRPEFFGYGFDTVANAAKEYKARTGSDTEFTQFWNELDTGQAQRRYELFGATLTDNEQAEWNRIALSPKDSPPAAVAKLNAQKRLIERQRQIRARMLQGQGYQVPASRPPLSQFGSP